jgi:hypothetical protein
LSCLRSWLLPTLILATLTSIASPVWAAWPHDPAVNVPLCVAAGDQANPVAIPDGSGGSIVTWQDARSGGNDIYAQRVSAAGVPLWTSDGVGVCVAAGEQTFPVIASDGAGGAIISWSDTRSGSAAHIYVQRVSAAGATLWTGNGVAICLAANDQTHPTVVSDDLGGAIVTWTDYRNGIGNVDIYAQRVNAAGAVQWLANGVAVAAAVHSQYYSTIASDGASGAIITWQDYRSNSSYDVYAQRINSAGVPQWVADGVALGSGVGDQLSPAITSDGVGGAIVIWPDNRAGSTWNIYLQRISGAGVVQWAANGVTSFGGATVQPSAPAIVSDGAGGAFATWQNTYGGVSTVYIDHVSANSLTGGITQISAPAVPYAPALAADGGGGAILTWYDYRVGANNIEIYAQHYNAAITAQWASNGIVISNALGNQAFPIVVSDGAGSAIIAWMDQRAGNYDIYAQRIDRDGQLGDPAPAIASVRDVPNDQGGKVKVSWNSSYLDAYPGFEISSYWIWRSVPPNYAAQAVARGAHLLAAGAAMPLGGRGALTTSIEGAQTLYWEYVDSQPANGDAGYSYAVSTLDDSIGASNPRTLFRIEARDVNGTWFWNSAADSGYSVDNLPPVVPAPFTAAYLSGATHLHWGENSEPDLAGYRVYRGTSAGFIPSAGNLIAAKPDTGWSDAGAAGSYYKLSAVDIHGNESPFSLLGPGGTLDVGGSPLAFALGRLPNPSLGGRLAVTFSLPSDARATLVLVDVSGRQVSAQEVGAMGAGSHSISLAAGGRLAAGMYFVRLTQGTRSATARVTVLE